VNLPQGYSVDTVYDSTFGAVGGGSDNLPFPRTWEFPTGLRYYPYNVVAIVYPVEPIFPKQKIVKVKLPPVKKKKAYFRVPGQITVPGGAPISNRFGENDSYPMYPVGTILPQYFTPVEQPVSWPILLLVGAAFYLFLTWTK